MGRTGLKGDFMLPTGIRIVEYEEKHAVGLARMWNESAENWGGRSDLRTAQSIIDAYRSASFFNVYVALDGDDVVGLCSFGPYFRDTDAAYIQVLNVRPDYLSKKIGKALVLRCVERTIELGLPRLELHTWGGNTKAVPLYKKCGFMWEDDPEQTLLSNFIPTLLRQELLKTFFDKMDWYKDNARGVDIVHDGVKEANFERFTYIWEKDGERLATTVEKFGRKICRIETNDYMLEIDALDHELAYGFAYGAVFRARNKSGKPLRLAIKGKNDGVIAFDFAHSADLEGDIELRHDFNVSKPAAKQDPHRKHPCVLADVVVNGLSVEMGVGIEAKAPLVLTLEGAPGYTAPGPTAPGRRFDAYVNIQSAMHVPAKIRVNLPKNDYIDFENPAQELHVGSLGKACLETSAKVLKIGHICLEIPCRLSLADGRDAEIVANLDIVNHGPDGRFACMLEDSYGIVNGMFGLVTTKNNNYSAVKHASGMGIEVEFPVARLGKPYEDEFNLVQPADIKVYESGANMVMELAFASTKQPGITLHTIFTLSASGALTRRHRLENTGNTEKTVFLNETTFTGLFANATYRYDGRISRPSAAQGTGFDGADNSLFSENWVFEDGAVPVGVCWDPALRPVFRWYDGINLESEWTIPPGESLESQPMSVFVGTFKGWASFRDYAMGLCGSHLEHVEDLQEIIVNNFNPFIHEKTFPVSIRNNRNVILAGDVEVCGRRQSNPDDERVAENVFDVEESMANPLGGVGHVDISTNFPIYQTHQRRAVFFPRGEVATVEKGGILTVSNGAIEFAADARHCAAMISLKDGEGQEWLLSKHPVMGPHAWWSHFVGGISMSMDKFDTTDILKESASADFVRLADGFGNKWQGIRTQIDITRHKEYKGLTYAHFFLTLPGVPVMCYFTSFTNNTGAYISADVSEEIFMAPGEGETWAAEVIHSNGKKRRFIVQSDEIEILNATFFKISSKNDTNFYYLPNLKDPQSSCEIHNDIHVFSLARETRLRAKNAATTATKPTFAILSKAALTPDNLCALERIEFNSMSRI